MLRIVLTLCLSLSLVLTVFGLSWSEYRFRDGTEIEVQWYEQEGEILSEHVCFNYKEDARKYRECRKKAKDYFSEECEFYTDKIKQTQKKYKYIYHQDQQKFCNASKTYTP